MKKKNFWKRHWVYVGMLAIIILVLLNQQIAAFLPYAQVNQTCVNEKKNKYSGFIEGQILVIFNGNVTELETKMNSYGLSILLVREDLARIQVPRGNELVWICILEKEKSLISDVTPNYYTKPLG